MLKSLQLLKLMGAVLMVDMEKWNGQVINYVFYEEGI
jgi:hypothetical protein